MKKFFLLLLTATFFIACEGPEGPPGRDGYDGTDMRRVIQDFEILSSDWREVRDNNGLFIRYEYVFNFDQLTEYVYNNGLYAAYLEVVEDGFLVQKSLPYTTTHEDSRGYLWEQRLDCDYSTGSVGFYVTNTDFREERPGTLLMRFIAVWWVTD